MKLTDASPILQLVDDTDHEISTRTSIETLASLAMNGKSIAETTFDLIESAQKEIISAEFLLRDDQYGKTKLALLRRKALEGKTVIVHVDAFHLLVNPAIIFQLMRDGVQFTMFNRLSLKTLSKFSFRNHCKALIIDQDVMKTGDSNTGDEYAQWQKDFQMMSLDLIIQGPVVREARSYILDIISHPLSNAPDLQIANTEKVEEQRKQIQNICRVTEMLFRAMQIQVDAPEHITRPETLYITDEEVQKAKESLEIAEEYYYRSRTDCFDWRKEAVSLESLNFYCDPIEEKGPCRGVHQSIVDFCKGARSSLTIVSPYLILTPIIKSALQEALQKNISIRIYTNSLQSTDNRTTQLAYEYRLNEISSMGPIEIYEYQGPETLHAKFMIRDQSECMIMTYNIDWRSELKNLETALQIPSPLLTQKLKDWLHNHHDKYRLVLENERIYKSPIPMSGPSDYLKKIIIQSIEKHL